VRIRLTLDQLSWIVTVQSVLNRPRTGRNGFLGVSESPDYRLEVALRFALVERQDGLSSGQRPLAVGLVGAAVEGTSLN